MGNRTSRTVNGAETIYVYDDNDRLLSSSEDSLETTYDYDAQGNQLAENDGSTSKTYSYNANNKLTGFSDGTNTLAYQYNSDGIRVNKTLNGALTSYVVDSNQEYAQVIAELDDTDTLLKAYLYGTDLIAQESENNWRFYHYDSLGTTRDLSDNSGSITDSYNYEAFGSILSRDGETDNAYLYTGEQYDPELDNYYLRARYYDQDVGRFTQMDEWPGIDTDSITLNKYLYAYSDGINLIDPSGLFGLRDIMAAQTVQNTLRNISVIGRSTTGAGANTTGRKLIWNGGCFIVEEIAESYISNAIGLYVFDDTNIKKPYVGQSKVNVVSRLKDHFRATRATVKNVTAILPVSIASGVADRLEDVLDALEQSFIEDMDGPGGADKGINSEGKSANKRNQVNTKKRKYLKTLMEKFKICPN